FFTILCSAHPPPSSPTRRSSDLATPPSLQIRTATRRPARAANAPLRRLVPVRLQQGAGVAERALRARREEAGLRRAVQDAHRVAQQRGNGLAGRCAGPSLATGAQGFGAGLQQLLRQAGRLSTFQEERPARQLPLPRPEAD